MTSVKTLYCGPVDKTTDSQSSGPRFESAGSGSSERTLINGMSQTIQYIDKVHTITHSYP